MRYTRATPGSQDLVVVLILRDIALNLYQNDGDAMCCTSVASRLVAELGKALLRASDRLRVLGCHHASQEECRTEHGNPEMPINTLLTEERGGGYLNFVAFYDGSHAMR